MMARNYQCPLFQLAIRNAKKESEQEIKTENPAVGWAVEMPVGNLPWLGRCCSPTSFLLAQEPAPGERTGM